MTLNTTEPPGSRDGLAGDLVSQLPDLTAVSLEQAQSVGASALSFAVQRVLDEADAGVGCHLAGYMPSAFF